MNGEDEGLKCALIEALQHLAIQRSAKLVKVITPVVLANLVRGRVQVYLDKQVDCQPRDYVWRVSDHYERWHLYLYKVQVEKQADTWQPLFVQLQKWAYNYLRRRRFGSVTDRFQHAVDCATETAGTLINAFFPYDVDFDPWACIMVHNVCQKYVARAAHPVSIAAKDLVDVQAWEGWLRNFHDSSSLDAQEQIELRQDLLAAVKQLSSDARKQFIVLYYFDHNTFEQIAARLDRPVNALYKLHSDALRNLKQIIEAEWT